jgi:hypothetical protein
MWSMIEIGSFVLAGASLAALIYTLLTRRGLR